MPYIGQKRSFAFAGRDRSEKWSGSAGFFGLYQSLCHAQDVISPPLAPQTMAARARIKSLGDRSDTSEVMISLGELTLLPYLAVKGRISVGSWLNVGTPITSLLL